MEAAEETLDAGRASRAGGGVARLGLGEVRAVLREVRVVLRGAGFDRGASRKVRAGAAMVLRLVSLG